MPTRSTLLDPHSDDPLVQLAIRLRDLRDAAPAGRPLSVDQLVHSDGTVSRAAVYSALNGKTLPSRHTLTAMVRAWAANRDADVPMWMAHRSATERACAQRSQAAMTLPRPVPSGRRQEEKGNLSDTSVLFGADMRRLRVARLMSLADLSEKIHFSKGFLSKVETGRKKPSLALAEAADAALEAQGELLALVADSEDAYRSSAG